MVFFNPAFTSSHTPLKKKYLVVKGGLERSRRGQIQVINFTQDSSIRQNSYIFNVIKELIIWIR